jgi:O-antigen ligase
MTFSNSLRLTIAVLIFLPITCSVLYGHDLQRLTQILIGFLALAPWFTGAFHRRSVLIPSRDVRIVGLIILLAGIISILRSQQPGWAICELSLLIICWNFVFYTADARRSFGRKLDDIFIGFVLVLCLVKVLQFVVSGIAAFASHPSIIDTDLLLEGFSNKRFYGQFQTFTLPLLALPLLRSSSNKIKLGALSLLSLWWMIAISGGTRGTWLGLIAATLVMLICGASGRRWAGWQVGAAILGGLLFLSFFSALPSCLGIETLNFAGDRLSTSLSAREIIWHQAWEMIKERPLLGFGPMHFADIPNPVAAHPHQAILQWACEWGIPSTLLVMWLVSRGLWATFRVIRANHRSTEPVDLLRVCLFASLIGALTQSMVDGVIVMPYSQLWLAIVVGWLIGIHEFATEPPPVRVNGQKGWVAILTLAVAYLGYIAVRDVPNLEQREQVYIQEHGGRFQPRFWMQGVIAKPGSSLLEQTNTANFAPLATPK